MPNSLNQFLAGRRKRETSTVPAVIDRAVGDGTGDYFCTLLGTGEQVKASVQATGNTFTMRTPVMLSRPDDGTTSRTSGWVITKFGAAANWGVSAPVPASSAIAHAGLSVAYVSPGSIVLSAGGASVVFDLYGTGLLNSSITSVAGITLTGTLVTDSRITISAAAGGGVAQGTYDLTVDANNVLRGFITVI